MKVLHSNLLVKPLPKDKAGKIVMPDTVQDEWHRGEVIDVGLKVEAEIEVGDVVIYPPPPPHLGEYPTVGNDGYIIIGDNMALAKE